MEKTVDINAGGASSFAITETGDLYMWGSCTPLIGYNKDGTFMEPIRHSFFPILYSKNVVRVNPRLCVNIVLKQDGTVWLCGFTENEKQYDVPLLDISFSNLPVTIAEDVINISTQYSSGSDYNILLLKNNGKLYYAKLKTDSNGIYQGYDIRKIMDNVKVVENQSDKESAQFMDLPDSAEKWKSITHLAKADIISGIADTEFMPDKAINRAETAALMLRMTGKENESGNGTFADVPQNSWYYNIAGASQKYHIFDGYEDNTFRGEETVSELQLVALAARTLRNEGTAPDVDEKAAPDLFDIPDWAKPDIEYAYQYGIVTADELKTLSDKGMTRGDAAVILYRLYQVI